MQLSFRSSLIHFNFSFVHKNINISDIVIPVRRNITFHLSWRIVKEGVTITILRSKVGVFRE